MSMIQPVYTLSSSGNKVAMQFLVLLAVGVSSCASPVSEDSERSVTLQDISIYTNIYQSNTTPPHMVFGPQSGTVVSDDAWGMALVQLSISNGSYPSCTSVIINDQWLLTAGHCLLAPASEPNWGQLFDKSRIYIQQGPANCQNGNICGYIVQDYYVHPYVDVALIKLNQPLLNPNSSIGSYSRSLFFGSTASLVGKSIRCFGYGTDHILRYADFTVNGTSHWNPTLGCYSVAPVRCNGGFGYNVKPNTSGQIMVEGDSGGPCLLQNSGWDAGNGAIAGIQSVLTDPDLTTYDTDYQVSSEAFRDWAYGIMQLAPTVYGDPTGQVPGYQGAARAFTDAWGNQSYNAWELSAQDGGNISGSHLTNLSGSNVGISSLRVPVNGSITLYDASSNSYYAGSGSVIPNLSSVAFNDKSQSLKADQWVTIYVDGGYQGNSDNLYPGVYNFAWFYNSSHVGNDQLSAIRIPGGWRVKLFENDLSGNSITYYGGNVSWIGYNWNDKVSSMVIQEPALVFENPLYGGNYSVLWPGDYSASEMGVAGVSSLRVPSGWTLMLCDHLALQGTCQSYVINTNYRVGGSTVASIRVTANY